MWEQIRSNQVRSVILIALIAGLLLAVGYFLGLYFFDSAVGGLVIALVVWAIMSLIAFFQGDSILLGMAKARKIKPDDAPRLYNVVEEMKIASGLEKMPDVYIIDDPAPNAFATGRDPSRASVAITTGLLQKLNRDELQGVIGHEIAHIKNRDVLLMAITAVMLGTIVILSWYASRFLLFGAMTGSGRRSSSRSSGGGAQAIILIVGIVLMILAPIIAQFIYYAISRKREYLADASSALYTRYPEGLASALEKIGSSTRQLKSANKATAPMYTVNPLNKEGMKVSDLTSTHPPISERIRILRAMAGGASFADYNDAYRKVHSGKPGIISKNTATVVGAVGIREASLSAPGELALASGKSAGRTTPGTHDVSDLTLRLDKWRTVDCECGARWKVPPGFRDDNILCTRCGRRIRL
ncbi:MAG: M48 family metallopeptidase [Dehalococcoidales bacterium]|nr:M48 family metallopeptidase [Dehalococcoidales bacterium]